MYLTQHPSLNSTPVRLLAAGLLLHLLYLDIQRQPTTSSGPDTSEDLSAVDVTLPQAEDNPLSQFIPQLEISDKVYQASGTVRKSVSQAPTVDFWSSIVGPSLNSMTPLAAPCTRSYNSFNRFQLHD